MTPPSDSGLTALPHDPTFPPEAYERVSRLLRGGVLAFLVLAGVGMVARLVAAPYESVSAILASPPGTEFGSVGGFFVALANGQPSALITLGIFVMVGVTIGRVGLAAVDFARGRERVLAAVSVVVVVLLVLGLLVVAPFVR